MPKMSPALAKRHTQSAIVSVMMISIIASVRRAYQRKRNAGSVVEEILVAMAIRQNDEANGAPLTVSGIAKMLNVPRSNVKRATDDLIGVGMIRKEGAGFVGNLAYLEARLDADYFKDVLAAILKAADALRKIGAAWVGLTVLESVATKFV